MRPFGTLVYVPTRFTILQKIESFGATTSNLSVLLFARMRTTMITGAGVNDPTRTLVFVEFPTDRTGTIVRTNRVYAFVRAIVFELVIPTLVDVLANAFFLRIKITRWTSAIIPSLEIYT